LRGSPMKDSHLIAGLATFAVLGVGAAAAFIFRPSPPSAASTAPPPIVTMRPSTRAAGPATAATIPTAAEELARLRRQVDDQRQTIERQADEIAKLAAELATLQRAAATVRAEADKQRAAQLAASTAAADERKHREGAGQRDAARSVYDQLLRLKSDRESHVDLSVFSQHLSDASFAFTKWEDGLTAEQKKSELYTRASAALASYRKVQGAENVLPDMIAQAKQIESYDDGSIVKGRWSIVFSIEKRRDEAEKNGAAAVASVKKILDGGE
jgi:hypothetical protein